MLPDRYTTVQGSGTFPHYQASQAVEATVASIVAGTLPVAGKSDMRSKSGMGVVVLNPEDLSIQLGLKSQSVTVGITAVPLPENAFVNRRALVIHNLTGNDVVYIGASDVTISNGMPLVAGEKIAIDIQGHTNVTIYAISGTADQDVRIMELS